MSCRIEFSHFVKSDLKDVFDWYNEIDRKLTIKFLHDFEIGIKFIQQFPEATSKRYGKVRICFLKKFPYGIHYQFSAIENTALIIGVYHTSRNPKIWQERK